MNKPILLAGTRLTGDKMHIGTYYGWIYQIKRARNLYNPIVIISDYQSLDYLYTKTYYEEAQILKQSIQYFLPDVPVIIESDINKIVELGFRIFDLVKHRYYKRIMPIRKQIEEKQKINLPMILYPSLMVADILALNASAVFNKPEGKFQHSEIMNCILHDLNIRLGSNYSKLDTFKKDVINILSLDGTGPMKRNRLEHGVLEIDHINYEYLASTLRYSSMDSLISIATSIKCEDVYLSKEHLAEILSNKIYAELSEIPMINEKLREEQELQILDTANNNVAEILDMF